MFVIKVCTQIKKCKPVELSNILTTYLTHINEYNMKWFIGILIVLTMTALFCLGLFQLFNSPVDVTNTNNKTAVEFTDIVTDDSERNKLTATIQELIRKPQSCNAARDCIKTYYGCPFGCSSVVNLSNHVLIQQLKNNLDHSSGSKCTYRCMNSGKETAAACIDNICTLVDTIDGQRNIREFIDKHKKAAEN